MRNLRKRPIIIKCVGWLLSLSIIASILIPVIGSVYAANQLTGAEKLGSPLLDANFTTDEWNPKELAVFGIFLSNMSVPLIDNYATAFGSGGGGSEGRGRQILLFSTDSQAEDMLKDMVAYAAEVQNSNNLVPIYCRKLKIESGKVTPEEWQEANLFQFLTVESGTSGGGITSVDGTYTDSTDVSGCLYSLGQYGVKRGGSGDEYEIVFDFTDGYDIQTLAVGFHQAMKNSAYGTAFKKAYMSYTDGGSSADKAKAAKLYMDPFGNIVARIDQKNIVVYPACVNQYVALDSENQGTYNLVNSMYLAGKYTNASSDALSKKVKAEGTSFTDNNIDAVGSGNLTAYHSSKQIEGLKNLASIVTEEADRKTYFPVHNKIYTKYHEFASEQDKNKYIADMFESNLALGEIKVPLKFDVCAGQDEDTYSNTLFHWDGGELESLIGIAYSIGYGTDPDKKMLTEIDFLGKKKYSIFEEPVGILASKGVIDPDEDETSEDRNARGFLKFLAKSCNGAGDGNDKYGIANKLRGSNEAAHKVLEAAVGSPLSQAAEDYIDSEYGDGMTSSDVDMGLSMDDDPYFCAYTKSAQLSAVASYLGYNADVDGEISQMCSNMYFTYLKWYGVIKNDYGNKLNPSIFKENSDIFKKDIKDFMNGAGLTEEEKKKEVLNKTYLMLDPEKGRELRKQIAQNSFNDTMFDWYSKIVYGSGQYKATSNKEGSVAATQASEGFLGVDNYYSNPFTSWFVKIYDDIAIILIGIGLIVIIIIWLLMKKKALWILTSISLLISVVLLTPSIGDIVPYVTDKVIMKSFSSQLGYWALCENVEQMRIAQTGTHFDSNGDDISTEVAALVNELNLNYADRALMLKYDISRKVTSSALASMDELQNLKTSLWLLPQIMRQFSAEDGNTDYVYVPMSDALQGARLLYGAYDPRTVIDIDSQMLNPIATSAGSARTNVFCDLSDDFNYTLLRAPDSAGIEAAGLGLKPLIAETSNLNLHKTFYYLSSTVGSTTDKLYCPNVTIGYRDPDTGDRTITWTDATKNKFYDFSATMEKIGGEYNNLDPSTVKQEYGYMWMSESPLVYMYFVMKDTYTQYSDYYSDLSTVVAVGPGGGVATALDVRNYETLNITERSHVKNIVKMIQGQYVSDSLTGTEHRANFMYDGITGATKDFLDLRHLVTNATQYMYKMHLLAGGNTGKDGIFGEDKVSLYTIYKNNYKAWMFRCNWAEKIYTNKEFNEPYRIKVPGTGRVKVDMQIMPQHYVAAGRQMVFSEAEMKSLGLSEKDLSIVELKCLEINRKTAKDITLLLNYINMDGLTTEALIKQMALIATNNFCQYMSPDNGFNNQMALYPQNVDLRNISFDAVARVMVLGATNDSYYTYGNVMYNMIANSDIISVIMLLLTSFLCVFFIPLLRNFIMALLLFLGLFATITNFLAGEKQRWKVMGSYVINLLIFLATNIMFYLILSMLMGMSSPNDILKGESVGISVRSPAWILFILLALCIIYVICAWKQLVFTIKNYKDMGATAFSIMFAGLADKITGGLSALGDKFSGNSSGGGAGGEGSGGGYDVGGNTGDGGGTTMDTDVDSEAYSDDAVDTGETSGYTDPTAIESDRDDEQDAADIDEKIERGKEDNDTE